MNKQTITERIKKVLTENQVIALKDMVDSISEETSLVRDLALDSIQILEIVIRLEKEFNFRCEPDELNLDMFDKFSLLIDFIYNKVNKEQAQPV